MTNMERVKGGGVKPGREGERGLMGERERGGILGAAKNRTGAKQANE